MEYDKFIDKVAAQRGTKVKDVIYIDRDFNPVERDQATTIKVVYENGDMEFFTRMGVFGASEVVYD